MVPVEIDPFWSDGQFGSHTTYICLEGVEPVSLNSDNFHCTVLGMSQGFLVEIRAVNIKSK